MFQGINGVHINPTVVLFHKGKLIFIGKTGVLRMQCGFGAKIWRQTAFKPWEYVSVPRAI